MKENDSRILRGFARKFSDKTSKQFPVISITSCIYAFYENGTKYVCLFMIKTGVMNFKTGQKVLCVNDHFGSYCAYPIKKGLIYTIHGFYKCDCGSDQVTLKEIPEELDVRIPEPQKEFSEERLKTINRKDYLMMIMSK